MNLLDIFPPERIFLALEVADKDGLLAELSGRAAPVTGIPAESILEALQSREELGSTCLGQGVAIPHARVTGLDRVVGFVAVLSEPLDFDAGDQEPVDIVLMLLMPENSAAEQMTALSRAAALVRESHMLDALRNAPSPEAVADILMDTTG